MTTAKGNMRRVSEREGKKNNKKTSSRVSRQLFHSRCGRTERRAERAREKLVEAMRADIGSLCFSYEQNAAEQEQTQFRGPGSLRRSARSSPRLPPSNEDLTSSLLECIFFIFSWSSATVAQEALTSVNTALFQFCCLVTAAVITQKKESPTRTKKAPLLHIKVQV